MVALSATQDIVLDAFRREILETEGELALGNSINVTAYRVSGLVPGSLGMLLVDQISWQAKLYDYGGIHACWCVASAAGQRT